MIVILLILLDNYILGDCGIVINLMIIIAINKLGYDSDIIDFIG